MPQSVRESFDIESGLSALHSASVEELHVLLRRHDVPLPASDDLPKLKVAFLHHLLSSRCMSVVGPVGCALVCNEFGLRTDGGRDNSENERVMRGYIFDMVKDTLRSAELRGLLTELAVPFSAADKVPTLCARLNRYLTWRNVRDESKIDRDARIAAAKAREQAFVQRQRDIARDWPQVLDAAKKQQLIDDFRARTSSAALARDICACCAGRTWRSKVTRMRFADIPRELLSMPTEYPSAMYPENIPASLRPALLHSDGIHADAEEIDICTDCHRSLQKNKLPALALANHTFVGDVPPELQNLTAVEEALIGRTRAKAWIVHLRSEGDSVSDSVLPNMQRGLKGHTVIYPQRPERLLTVLPPSIDDILAMVCVVFVGSSPPDREWLLQKAKPLAVHKGRVMRALTWLKANNPLYAHVEIDMNIIQSLPENGTLPFSVSTVSESEAQAMATSRYDPSSSLRTADTDVTADQEAADDVYQRVVIADVHGNTPMSELRAATLRHLKEKGLGYVEVPHDPVPVNEFCNPDLFPMIYPTLYPYGIGGFEDKPAGEPQIRRVRLSLKRHVKHLLDIADRRFQTHPSFMFVVFNILQRREVLLRSSLKTKQASFAHVAAEFSQVSSLTIAAVCEKISAGIKIGSTEDERRVFDLMNQVNLVSMNVPGSPASKAKMRNELRGMMIEYGLPSFYITVNPADVYNPIVRLLAGEEIDVDHLPMGEESQYWKQSILVAKNPVVAAQFFSVYMNAFMECLLVSNKGLEGDGGVLGHVKAHFGCVEAQGRGTLHCHMVVWIEGALNPNEMRERVLAADSDEFRRRMIEWIDDVISTSLPHVEEGEDNDTATGNPCCHRGPSDSLPSDLLQVLRKRDLLDVVKACQVHKHNSTCYKYCKPGEPRECRFDLDPSNVRAKTEFDDETGELCLQCLDGMVNNFNAVMIRAIRNNMDIKFIASGDAAKAILYYITDYITKTPLKAHVAYAALEVAVNRLEKQIDEGDELTVRAKKMLQKCSMFMITHQEMSGQQVSSSLLELPEKLCSDEFANLYWIPFERFVEQEDPSPECYSHETTSSDLQPQNVEDPPTGHETDTPFVDDGTPDDLEEVGVEDVIIELDAEGVVRRRGNQVADYVHRGTMLDSISLWAFVSRVRKIDGLAGDEPLDLPLADVLIDDYRSRPTCSLRPQHSESDRKILQLCSPEKRKIPVPLGPSLPRRDVEAVYPKYARMMLILFKPWRSAADLRSQGQSWRDAFQSFVTGADPRTLDILDNMHIMHECKDCRDDHIRNRAHHLKRPIISTEFTARAVEDDFEQVVDDVGEEEILAQLLEIEKEASSRAVHASKNADECVRAALGHGLLSVSSDFQSEGGHHQPDVACEHGSEQSAFVVVEREDNNVELTWKAEYDRRRALWKKSLTVHENPSAADGPSSAQPVIRTVDTAHVPEPQVNVGTSTIATPDSTDLARFVADWTLNREQQRAFEIVAQHASRSIPMADPLRMYLGGAGGTGKSRVIKALKAFFDARGESRRFRLCSFTGVAARNISGSTLHSALSLHQSDLASKKGSKVNEELVNMWEGVDYLFIDEVSMVGCRLLAKVSRALSLAKEKDEIAFGGISIIFAGDFAQLPCVRETRLYAHLDFSQYRPDTVLGKLLWLSVDTVVILTEQKRQEGADNIPFVQLLDRLRDGACTRDDFDMLNTRLLENCEEEVQGGRWSDVPVIVTDNQAKDALNEKAVSVYALSHGKPLNWYYCKDVYKTKRANAIGPGQLRDRLISQPSGVTEQRLGKIPLVEGMQVIVCQNHDVHGGVVNGSVGILKSVRYYVDDFGTRHLQSCVVYIPESTFDPMDGLERNEAPILPDEKTFKLERTGQKPLKIQRTQVPLQPGYSFTAHRAQGQSYGRVVVDLQGSRSLEAAYVMLSRVVSLSGLLILRSFAFERIVGSRDNARLKEDRRLNIIRLQTIVRTSDSSAERVAASRLLRELSQPSTVVPVVVNRILNDDDLRESARTINRALEVLSDSEDLDSHRSKRRRHV